MWLGISAGQSLVKQASIRSTLSQTDQFRLAYNTFKLQYDAIPGDMTNAVDYWGAGTTSNGDGNKRIGHFICTMNEQRLVWEHLSLAGLLNENYTGLDESLSRGVNVPESGYSSAATFSAYGYSISAKYPVGNSLYIYDSSISGACIDAEQIIANDAINIDNKVDDGRSGTGRIIGYHQHTDGQCATQRPQSTYDPLVTEYIPSDTSRCIVHFAFDDYIFK